MPYEFVTEAGLLRLGTDARKMGDLLQRLERWSLDNA
jgi:hypothetical protein